MVRIYLKQLIKNVNVCFSKPDGKSGKVRNACLYQTTNSKEQVWEIASYGFLEYDCIEKNHISIWLVISSQYLSLSEELNKISCSFSADICLRRHFPSWLASKKKSASVLQLWNLVFFFNKVLSNQVTIYTITKLIGLLFLLTKLPLGER